MNTDARSFFTDSLDNCRSGSGLARPDQLVSAGELAALLTGIAPIALLEVGCGLQAQFEAAHIPGAIYLDTSEIECAPLFNKVDDHALLGVLLSRGIHCKSVVVLYGRNQLAAARAAHLMLYAGVADVRMLDGDFAHWQHAGLGCASGPSRARQPVAAFGATFPLCPHYLSSTVEARGNPGALVSVRTWREYSGASSGYSYIAARGDIAGARWGRAGHEGDVNSMSAYQQPDGRMLPGTDIESMWESAGITRLEPSLFYCGTGWRASLAFFYAWLMGWDQISVYDGGWFEWSLDPANPVVIHIGEALAA
jgi:thiosulfate/3-mercaptopyruvate sulfurtransferase